MARTVRIAQLMDTSGVKFGTSGARGLVSAMSDEVCYAYVAAFVQYLRAAGQLEPGGRVAVAGDLRASTKRILRAVLHALRHHGLQPVHCGRIPSPAVALYGLKQRIPAIMVTGSHIPEDRNGIKFNTAEGEILKRDEQGIRDQHVTIPDDFDADGMLIPASGRADEPVETAAAELYVKRYVEAYAPHLLQGKRLGLYGHSAVGRDLLEQILTALGAQVTRLGYSDLFIPVDTEAIRPEDVALGARWASEQHFDAIVSTDGDSDRPLIADEQGRWLRGDVAGILCARQLGAEVVVTPVSCNTAVEKTGAFQKVIRTRIGSPYVIEAMMQAAEQGARRVVGYEANGGFLTASPIDLGTGVLEPLPTRDPVIVHLSLLAASVQQRKPLSALCSELPARHTASNRLKEFPTELSQAKIGALQRGGAPAIESVWSELFGHVQAINTLDGLRVTFASGDILHLRPSGNAPELRCYTESSSAERAAELNNRALAVLEGWRESA